MLLGEIAAMPSDMLRCGYNELGEQRREKKGKHGSRRKGSDIGREREIRGKEHISTRKERDQPRANNLQGKAHMH